jgi:hypothetical protein
VSFFVAFDAEGVLGSCFVVPLSSPSSALQLEMEGHAVSVMAAFSLFL